MQTGAPDACAIVLSYDYDSSRDRRIPACEGWLALCDRGHQRSCAWGAGCLTNEPGFPEDIERALALYETSCQSRDRVGCRGLALLVERGVYVEADPKRAFTLMRKACDLDDPHACAQVGRYYERGIGTKPDRAAAVTLYRASCARGIKQLPCEALERLGESPPVAGEP